MMDNVAQGMPMSHNQTLRTATGVKDTFLQFFLDKVYKAKKGLTGAQAESAERRIFSQMPTQPFNPLSRVKGHFFPTQLDH